tara:strand:+ start:26668 stop:31866 length:5199 start_codon:yes stop_codon:yes gene_type:complete
MDYYNDELKKLGAGAPPVTPARKPPRSSEKMDFFGGGEGTPKAEEESQSPLNWLMDIISRPLYGVTNAVRGGIGSGVAAGEKFSQGDTGGGLADALGTVVGAPGRFLEGFTSNDPSVKKGFAQTIEEGTDAIGKATDPNYVDRQDNVDAAFKGVAGFAGDVALDPLTWVPGAVLAKGAGAAVKGTDKVLSGISESLVGAKYSRTLPEAVVKAPKGKKSKPEDPLDENLFEGNTSFEPSAAPRSADEADSGKVEKLETLGTALDRVQGIFKGVPFTEPRPAGVAPKLAIESGQEAAPAAARASDAVPEAPPVVREAPVREQPPVPDEILDAEGAIPTPGASLNDLIKLAPARGEISDVLSEISKTMTTAARSTPSSANEWFKSLSPDTKIWVGGGYGRNMTRDQIISTIRAAAPGSDGQKQIMAAVAEAHKAARSATGTGKITARTAFDTLRANMESSLQMRNSLGDDLYDYLDRANSPEKFHKLLDQLKAVIEPTEDVADTLRNIDGNLSRIVSERLGLPRSTKGSPEDARRAMESSDPYQAALATGLAKALDTELVDLAEKGHIYFIKKNGLDVSRTSRQAGKGEGRYVDQLNGFSQYTMYQKGWPAVKEAALNYMRARGIKNGRRPGDGLETLEGIQRTQVYKAAVMQVFADQAKLLDDIGAHMSIGVGADTVLLSMDEVYRGVLASAQELGTPRAMDMMLFNTGTQAAPTAITNAAAAAVKGATREEILEILTDPRKYGNKGLIRSDDGKFPNNMVDGGRGWGFTGAAANRSALDLAVELSGLPRAQAKSLLRGKRANAKTPNGAVRQQDHIWVSSKGLGKNFGAERVADAIMDAAPTLRVRAAENEAAFVARTKAEIHRLSSDELQRIEDFIKEPIGSLAKIQLWRNKRKRIEADASKMAASADAAVGAEAVVDAALGTELVSTVSAATKAQTKADAAGSAIELRQATDSFADDVWTATLDDFDARPAPRRGSDDIVDAEIVDDLDETLPPSGDWRDMLYDEAAEYIQKSNKQSSKKKDRKGKFVDLSQDLPAMIDNFGNRIIDPYGILKRKVQLWFDQNALAQTAMPIARAFQNSMGLRSAYMNHQLNALHKAAKKVAPDDPTDYLAAAFARAQRGAAVLDPNAAKIQGDLEDAIREFFDIDADGSMGNVFFRTTGDVQAVNAMLRSKDIKHQFNFDDAAKSGLPLDKAIAGQWRDWKIKDPLDFLHRLTQAREELSFNRGGALSFIEMAKKQNAIAYKRTPGFVRIQASGESRFARYLSEYNGKPLYVKKELAEEMQRVEQVYRTSREFNGVMGDFVRQTYAPLLNAWKFAITLPRPGHHIRNLIGDTSVTWMIRGNRYFAPAWKDAVKVMGARGTYKDANMLAAANRFGISEVPKGTDAIFTTDRFGSFSADELYALLAESGALPSYNIGEDFLPSTGRLSDVLGKITLRDTVVGEKLGALSQGRDHLSRFQHFIQALRQDAKGFKGSREELIQKAVKEVIKYHPDASLLTTAESKIRLAIPFYSWFGKIIPALVESAVRHPGRLSVFNKASYNWAVASGLDPESLSDPFPDDQLFPSFITNSALGPQFTANMLFPGADQQYIRTNPGIAHLDVMDTFGRDPLRGIAGMVSPLIRVPAELLSGGSWSTGRPIRDWSDYLDQSIPGINYVANVSGVSPTGSVESVLGGQGLDQQAKVAQGTKTDFDKMLSVANWVTGLGFQNLSRDDIINSAEFEKRDAAAAAKGQ